MRIIDGGSLGYLDVQSLEFGSLDGMPRRYDAYFLDRASELVPINELVLSRARRDGVRSAVEKMRSASEGRRPKREPVQAKRVEDYYIVVDGNSTVIVLALLGVREVPIIIL